MEDQESGDYLTTDELMPGKNTGDEQVSESHTQSVSSAKEAPAKLPYHRITTGRLHLLVAQQIAESIIGKQLVEGNELQSEQELGQQFGVSRTVIRAAIALLETWGLVDISHGKHTTVKAESEWNFLNSDVLEAHVRVGRLQSLINDIFHTRLALEVAAVEEAAEKATPQVLNKLKDLCENMEQLVQLPAQLYSPQDYHRYDMAFHQLLVDASGNRVLRHTLRILSEVIDRLAEHRPLQREELKIATRAHHRLYERVRAGDASGAAQIMREHILWAGHRWDEA